MFGKRLRSQFDNIRPSLEKKANLNQERQKKAHDSHTRVQLGDPVYVTNYGAGASWLSGKVTKKLWCVISVKSNVILFPNHEGVNHLNESVHDYHESVFGCHEGVLEINESVFECQECVLEINECREYDIVLDTNECV